MTIIVLLICGIYSRIHKNTISTAMKYSILQNTIFYCKDKLCCVLTQVYHAVIVWTIRSICFQNIIQLHQQKLSIKISKYFWTIAFIYVFDPQLIIIYYNKMPV